MKTDNLVKSLQRYNIRAEAYRKPPIGWETFALSISPRHKEGVVLINHGEAEVHVTGSRKRRQAAVTVKEKGRVVKRACRFRHNGDTKPDNETVERRLKAQFPIIMPNNAIWEVSDIDMVPVRGSLSKSILHWAVSGTVTATVVEPTTNHFLIGMDETRNFISPLSRQVKSVQEAHRILKPKGVKEGTLRQGEWFFVPCDKKMQRYLDKVATKQSGRILPMVLGETTHMAKSAIRLSWRRDHEFSIDRHSGDHLYARGYITDRRTGHHRALFLPKWHRVVKNREATIKVAEFQREALARRQRTFD